MGAGRGRRRLPPLSTRRPATTIASGARLGHLLRALSPGTRHRHAGDGRRAPEARRASAPTSATVAISTCAAANTGPPATRGSSDKPHERHQIADDHEPRPRLEQHRCSDVEGERRGGSSIDRKCDADLAGYPTAREHFPI